MSERKKVIYVAGPFRAQSSYIKGEQDAFRVHQNVMRAMEIGVEVWRRGAVALIPHANTMFFQGSAPDDVWLDGDLELLLRSDGVALAQNWRQSSGVRAEVKFARQHGVPVCDPWHPLGATFDVVALDRFIQDLKFRP